jgi:hypothetical protein
VVVLTLYNPSVYIKFEFFFVIIKTQINTWHLWYNIVNIIKSVNLIRNEECYLSGCNVVKSGRSAPRFRSNILPNFQGRRAIQTRNQRGAARIAAYVFMLMWSFKVSTTINVIIYFISSGVMDKDSEVSKDHAVSTFRVDVKFLCK